MPLTHAESMVSGGLVLLQRHQLLFQLLVLGKSTVKSSHNSVDLLHRRELVVRVERFPVRAYIRIVSLWDVQSLIFADSLEAPSIVTALARRTFTLATPSVSIAREQGE